MHICGDTSLRHLHYKRITPVHTDARYTKQIQMSARCMPVCKMRHSQETKRLKCLVIALYNITAPLEKPIISVKLYQTNSSLDISHIALIRRSHNIILPAAPKEGKVIVEGLNMVTKHVKPRRQGEQGGIVKAEGAIYACKVMPVCPKCGKATRVGHSVKDGKTVRVCRKCGAEL